MTSPACALRMSQSNPLTVQILLLAPSRPHQQNRASQSSTPKMKAIIAVPTTLALVYRAWSHKSLTPAGIAAMVLTAAAHSIHPWSIIFALPIVFFIAGTGVTKVCRAISRLGLELTKSQVKHDIKATLTLHSTGSPGGEGARTHIQGTTTSRKTNFELC